jgi:hypothetical protein
VCGHRTRAALKTNNMKTKIISWLGMAGLFAAMAARPASAQSYSIDWYKIAGGGGTSTNGQYSLSGTVTNNSATNSPSTGNLFFRLEQ